MNYTDKERQIFSYSDGQDMRFCDPLATYRKLMAMTGGKPNELQNIAVRRIKPPDPGLKKMSEELFAKAEADYVQQLAEICDAGEKLEALIRELFVMQPFDTKTGQGATLSDCLGVWEDFKSFLNQKKTPSANGPTFSTPTAGQQVTSPITANMSASS